VPTSLSYQNLKLTGGQKRLGGNSAAPLLVAGNLTFDGTLVSGSNLNSSGDTPGDYPTFAFGGSFVQLSSTTYDPARSVVFRPTGTGGPQTLDAGGGTIQLYDVFSPSGSNVSGFRLVGNGSVLMLGNAFDGGFALSDASTVLALDAGTTLRLSGGGRFFSTASGLLQPDPGANIELLRAGNGVAGLGTLPLDPAFTTVNNLLLNATAPLAAANTLLLSTDLMVSGATNLQSGALALGGNQLFVNGPLSVLNGSVTGSATSSLSLGGTAGALNALRFTSGGQTLRNLTLSRALAADVAELPLASPLSVGGALTLTNGVLTTSAPTLLTLTQGATVVGGSAASYVNGPLARATSPGAATTFFPIGKNGNYRPLTLTTATQTSTTFYRAEQVEGAPDQTIADPDPTGTPLRRVSALRYFTVTPYDAAGTGIAQPTDYGGTLTLSFGATDGVNVPNDPNLRVAKRDAAGPYANKWVNQGNTGSTGGAGNGPGGSGAGISGTVSSASFDNFSDFALGSLNPFSQPNPLPVRLVGFAATRASSGRVRLAWTTASEINSARFEVERGLDGMSFAKIGEIAAQGTQTTRTNYALTDAAAPAPALYYRLRQVDQDGSARYSATVAVAAAGAELAFSLSPNPATSSVSFRTQSATAYVVRSVLGQTLRAGTSQPDGAPTTLDVSALPAGVYLVELQAPGGRVVRRLVKE